MHHLSKKICLVLDTRGREYNFLIIYLSDNLNIEYQLIFDIFNERRKKNEYTCKIMNKFSGVNNLEIFGTHCVQKKKKNNKRFETKYKTQKSIKKNEK